MLSNNLNISKNNDFNVILSWLKSKKQISSIELIEIKKDSATTLLTRNKNEIIFVLYGEGEIFIDGENNLIKQGNYRHIPSRSV